MGPTTQLIQMVLVVDDGPSWPPPKPKVSQIEYKSWNAQKTSLQASQLEMFAIPLQTENRKI